MFPPKQVKRINTSIPTFRCTLNGENISTANLPHRDSALFRCQIVCLIHVPHRSQSTARCTDLEGDEAEDSSKKKRDGAKMCMSLAKCHTCMDISFAVRCDVVQG